MSSDPNIPFEPAPATIPDHQALECPDACAWTEPTCVNGENIQSSTSAGQVLGSDLTNARCAEEGEPLTLLARAGNALTKFVGDGFLQVTNGKAVLVKHLQLSLTQLWHYWVTPCGSSTPILSDPMPFPYGTVADGLGRIYGIQGFQDADTVHVWSFENKQWESKKLCELPIEVQKTLTQTAHGELCVFEEVPVMGDPSTLIRELKVLGGEGVVYLEKTAVGQVEGGCVENNFAYVAKVLEFPEIVQLPLEAETARHRLVYSSHGLYWIAE